MLLHCVVKFRSLNMSDSPVNCAGCSKELKFNSILKHLSHKTSCKAKYSDADLKELTEKCKKLSEVKKSSWKKKDYANKKEEFSNKNSLYRKKLSMVACRGELQRKYNYFNETRGELIRNLPLNDSSGSKSKINEKSIEEMMQSKFDELMELIRFNLKNFETHDEAELLNRIRKEWRKLEDEIDEILNQSPSIQNATKEQPSSSQKADQISNKVMCKSCEKSFEENGIFKHVSNMPSCKKMYELNGELEVLKANALKRKKKRDHEYYMNERENRAQEYQNRKKEYEFFKKFELFEKKQEDFESSYQRSLERAKRLFVLWRGEDWKGMEGERCRKEIERLRKSGNAEVIDDMVQIEKLIDNKINELEKCLEEVAIEVKEITGNWVFDEAEKWQKDWLEDCRVKQSMFQCVEHHIEEEIESLYVTAVQLLKDSATKIGQEIEPDRKDHELYKPMRWKRSYYLNGHFFVPRNVILK